MSYILGNGDVDFEFGKLLGALAESAGAKITEIQIRSYAEALSDVPFDALKMACWKARRECNFFPKIAEILKQLGPAPDDLALLAWTGLSAAVSTVGSYASVDVEDPAAAEALLVVFGSWPEFCELPDGPALALKRQEFMAAYRQARRRNLRGARRLLGACESSGAYPVGAALGRVWTATVTLDGRVLATRDRPQLAASPDRRALPRGGE